MSTFASTHGPLRPLPRPQVRPDLAGGVLRPPGRLRRRRPGRPRLRPRPRGRTACAGADRAAEGPRSAATRRCWPRCSTRPCSRPRSRPGKPSSRPAAPSGPCSTPSRSSRPPARRSTQQPDRSVLAGGTEPAEDTYTITARRRLPGITAVRLEVLPDDRLPSQGPGPERQRQPAPDRVPGRSRRLDPRTLQPVAIAGRRPTSTRPAGASPRRSTATTQTAWGIYPEVGKPHQAVFELAERPGARDGRRRSTFVLGQTTPPATRSAGSGSRSTTSPRPVRVIARCPTRSPRSSPCPPTERTPAQRQELGGVSTWPGRSTGSSPRSRRGSSSTPRPATSPPTPATSRPASPAAGPRPQARRHPPARAAAAAPGRSACVAGLPCAVRDRRPERRGRPPRRAGAMADRPGEPADLAVDRQPRLAVPLRPRPRRHAQRLRPDGLAADATPSCSTGWRPSSATAAARSSGCTG